MKEMMKSRLGITVALFAACLLCLSAAAESEGGEVAGAEEEKAPPSGSQPAGGELAEAETEDGDAGEGATQGSTPTAEEILDRVDENLTFDTRSARVTMIVEGRRTRTYEMESYVRGVEDAAVEYLSPPRERGTRMLKLGDRLWMYMPRIDRVQQISGHMLREGMMGSDVSYEDLMESPKLREMYEARVDGQEELDGRATFKLEMTARDEGVTYPRRTTWIDKETYIPLKQELYTADGMLLKTWTMSEIEEFEEDRRFPTRMTVEDHVIKDSVTRLEFENIRFGIELEDEIFSLRWVERR